MMAKAKEILDEMKWKDYLLINQSLMKREEHVGKSLHASRRIASIA
ncbi:hypothetical protein PVOR_18719 [Paenibacillus vortex V453]|uniref:Uncharacterized protein n=1 Tax=Paenibacillus vortex V453 TaxID=715225 RepID=A0A2R9SU70_9BACL|nr:hypothetical protein PVOR_18719 [Paenibacillus vortex V453]